jgi:hypothetical protein
MLSPFIRKFYLRRISHFLIIAFVAILGSCTFKSVFINHGEWVVSMTVTDYFGLDAQQKAFLKKQLKPHWRWLMVDRKVQLTTDLESFRTVVARGLKKSDADFLRGRITFWRSALINRLGQDSALLLYEVTSEQVSRLKGKLDKSDEKWEDMLDETEDSDFRDELLSYHKDNFKRWYGSISGEQLDKLAEIMPMTRIYATEILRQSKASRKEFIKLISVPKSTEQISAGLYQFVVSPRNFRAPELRDPYDKMTEDFWTNFVTRDAIATPEQHAYAAKQIQSFVEDWRSAAADLKDNN